MPARVPTLPCLALLALISGGCGQAAESSKELRLYTWADYFPEEVLESFKTTHKATLLIDTYQSPEAMMAKLQAGGAKDYDVVIAPDYYVTQMARAGWIRPLDHKLLPGLAGLLPELSDPAYDRGNTHSVPYQWGTSGLAYRRDKVAGEVDSWASIFDAESSAGPFIMLDEMRESIGAALKYQGHSLNETDPAKVEAARDLLFAAKARSLGFAGGLEGRAKVMAGDASLAMGYSGETLQGVEESPELAYVVPKEGGTIWVDSLAIASGAPHPELAHAFLAHTLEPANAAAISNYNCNASPVAAARALMDDALANDPAVYVSPELRTRLEFIHDLGEHNQLYDRVWTEIKSR